MSKSVIDNSKKVIKNILIAVATTVIGSTAIYFLGLNSKKKLSFLDKQEITSDTWKSYVTIENIYTKNMISLVQDAIQYEQYKDVSAQSEQESEKLKNSIGEFIETDGVDKEFVALLKKRVKTESQNMELIQGLYAGLEKLKAVSKSGQWPAQQTKDSVFARATGFVQTFRKILTGFFVEIAKLGDKFSEKYDQPFETTEFIVLQAGRYGNDIFDLSAEVKRMPIVPAADPGGKKIESVGEPVSLTRDYLVGKWNQDGNTITFSKNGKISWLYDETGKTSVGTWQLKNDRLTIAIKNHPTAGEDGAGHFVVTNTLTNSFTMQLSASTKEFYHLERL